MLNILAMLVFIPIIALMALITSARQPLSRPWAAECLGK